MEESSIEKMCEEIKQVLKNIIDDYEDESSLDCDKWPMENFVILKKFGSCVNNIVTKKITIKFFEWLSSNINYFAENISDTDIEKAKSEEENRSSNDPGLDVRIPLDTSKPACVIAEVKCNVPVNKTSYGSNQITLIEKDFEKLKIEQADYKFFVTWNYEQTEKALEKLLESQGYDYELIENEKLKPGCFVLFLNFEGEGKWFRICKKRMK